jgi:tetratricopeptide (TPR) repeat protein
MSKRRRSSDREPARRAELPGRAQTRIEDLCEGIIEAGWLVALAIVPLYFNVYSARTYEPDKTAVLRTIVSLMVAAWAWKVLSGGRVSRPATKPKGREHDVTRGVLAARARAFLETPLLPLVAALGLLLVLGSWLSVDPRLSWFGSYPRFQGTWAQLSYLGIFALTLTHLRSRDQWRRIAYVAILASLPVALYAVLQAMGLDPVPHSAAGTRVYSTLGNPIFLGAYLVMVMFITFFELGRALLPQLELRSEALDGPRRKLPGVARIMALTAVLLLQLLALVLSQSRGPFLGLLAGAYVFFLVTALYLRTWAGGRQKLSATSRRVLRWTWLVIIVAGLLAVGFLVLFSLPDSPLSSLRQVPYLGRLGTILDLESNSVQVRLLIWNGVVELMGSYEPLVPPGGTPDTLRLLRPILGFGPETLFLALNRHVAPELGQLEGRGDIPDRSHNETFDALVMSGSFGYLIWVGIYCGIFHLALKRLDWVRTRAQRFSFWINLIFGAALGTLAPYYLTGDWVFSGVGLPTGLMMGLVVFVTVEALTDRGAGSAERPLTFRNGLIVALLGTFVAHVIEIHFGIAIVSSRLYFWFLLAVLIVVAESSLQEQEPAMAQRAVPPEPRAKRRRKLKQTGQTRPEVGPSPTLVPTGLVGGLLAVVICAPLAYGILLNPEKLRDAVGVLANALLTATGSGLPIPGPLLWLILATLLVGAGLAGDLAPRRKYQTDRRLLLPFSLSSVGVLVLYALFQAYRTTRVIALQTAGTDLVKVVGFVGGHHSVFVAFIVLLTLAIGALLGLRNQDLRPWSPASTGVSAGAGLILVVAVGWFIQRADLNPVLGDTFLKQARALITAGKPDVGLRLLERACELSPKEPMNLLFSGQAAVRAANKATEPEAKARFFDAAESALRQARVLAPLDPDHSANLARYLVKRAESANDQRRRDLQLEASEEYAATLELRPRSVLFMNEWALLLQRLDKIDEAETLLERALVLDDRYDSTFLRLAAVHQNRASEASAARDREALTDSLERAVAMYERALVVKPGLEPARKGIAQLEPALRRLANRPPTTERLRELYGEDSRVHRSLAQMRLDAGRSDGALLHARLALELAPDEEKAAALEILAAAESDPESRKP